MVDLKNEADNTVHNTQKSLDEHRSKLQESDVQEIEQDINALRALLTENLAVGDIQRLKEAIEKAKNAAMKIGKALYANQGAQ